MHIALGSSPYWGECPADKAQSACGDPLLDSRNNSGRLRGFRALHGCWPIAGLGYSGKGANKTIQDCRLATPAERGCPSAAAGASGAVSLSGNAFERLRGGSTGAKLRKGVET